MKFPIASYPSPKIPSSNEEFKEVKMEIKDAFWITKAGDLKCPLFHINPVEISASKANSYTFSVDVELVDRTHVIPEPPLDKSRIELAIKKAVREWFPNMSDRLMDAIVKDFKEDIGWV